MKNRIAWMSGACLCLALSACVDDNYDLSDVDTTVKVPVNNLTVPVNIEPVQLKNILDIDDDSPVKEINGQYAISETGHFESSSIEVPDITLGKPTLAPSTTIINFGGSSSPRAASIPTEIRYNIASEQRDLIFESDFESTCITEVSKVGCDLSLTMNISIKDLEGIVSKIDYKNVSLQLPKGLLDVTVDNIPAAEYDFETGVLSIPAYQSTGHNLQLKIHTSGIDVEFLENKSEASFTPATDTRKGHISLSGEFYMLDGEAVILNSYINAGNITSIPPQTEMTVTYDLSPVTINYFSGSVQYTIEDVDDIPRVELSNMPDVLAQETTDLGLQNPQIYLTITNPLKQYDLKAKTGLKIIAKREGKNDREFTLDSEIELNSADSQDGVFRFCLSPENPAVKLEGFESAEWIEYSNLGQIIAGEGVPDALEIKLIKPRVPDQPVTDFALGVSVGTVTGDYELMAPLGITKDSQIIYTDDIDGWESEDLNNCTIEALNINLTVSSDIPVDTKLTGYPINTSGQRIMGADGKPLSVEGAYIPANADNHKVAIRISGIIPANSNLNGLRFEATATVPDENSTVLSPDMVITLTDIRPSITGYIIKDLDD